MLVLIDNYDSFTYNLVQAFGELGARMTVFRNDEIEPPALEELAPSGIVISPGPGTPDEAGISKDVVRRFAGRVPILGVCLGHQCIAEVFGSRVVQAGRILHGKTSPVHHDGSSLFHGVPSPFTATRYHSLVVDPSALSPDLTVTAWTAEGEIMGIRHRAYDVEGVQFHPESILTTYGPVLLANFLRRTGAAVPQAALRPRLPVERVGTAS